MGSYCVQLYVDDRDDIYSWYSAAERQYNERLAHKREMLHMLSSDSAVDDYMTHNLMPHGCWTRQGVYGSGHDGWFIINEHRDDPRAPVYMRGSRMRLISKYALSNSAYIGHESPNGWCIKIAERYLRKRKITSFDYLDFHNYIARPVELRLLKKYGITKHVGHHLSYLSPGQRNGDNIAWINGKRHYLDENQYAYLKKLHGIIKRFSKLEDRKRALFSAEQERRR